MNITVRTVSALKELVGQGEWVTALPEGSTVADLLASVAALHGSKVSLYLSDPGDKPTYPPLLRVLVNGADVGALQGRDTTLKDGDDVLMFTPIAGG